MAEMLISRKALRLISSNSPILYHSILLSILADRMDQHYTKLYITGAFAAGVLLCLGFKDFYPDLEWRFRRRPAVNRTIAAAGLAGDDRIDLEDHERVTDPKPVRLNVPEGIESCIGNTPLFKIKSLSDATGCEILGKAEVTINICYMQPSSNAQIVLKWRRWKSQRPSSFEHDHYGNSES